MDKENVWESKVSAEEYNSKKYVKPFWVNFIAQLKLFLSRIELKEQNHCNYVSHTSQVK